jgi:hypothetical protein
MSDSYLFHNYSGRPPEQCPHPEEGRNGGVESGKAALPLFAGAEGDCEAQLSNYSLSSE